MSTYEIKGMVMRFDSEREKDIIDYLRKLASQHRLGEFLASLVRAALSDDGKRSKESFEVAVRYAERYGISRERKEFFDNVEKQLREMKAKIDAIYEKAMYVYTLETAGKYLGVKDRAKQIVLAERVLEEQFKILCMVLGVSTLPYSFKGDKDYVDVKVENFLQGLFDRYGEILFGDEEKQERKKDIYEKEGETVKNSVVIASGSTAREEGNLTSLVKNNKVKVVEARGEPSAVDEIVDFGDTADWHLLDSFISPK